MCISSSSSTLPQLRCLVDTFHMIRNKYPSFHPVLRTVVWTILHVQLWKCPNTSDIKDCWSWKVRAFHKQYTAPVSVHFVFSFLVFFVLFLAGTLDTEPLDILWWSRHYPHTGPTDRRENRRKWEVDCEWGGQRAMPGGHMDCRFNIWHYLLHSRGPLMSKPKIALIYLCTDTLGLSFSNSH